MTTDEIKERLQGTVWKTVAKEAGVNYWTLRRFLKGERETQRKTLDKLRAYLEAAG